MKECFFYLIFILLTFSCKIEETYKKDLNIEDENTYKVISYLINNLGREIYSFLPGFPPPPFGGEYNYSTRDSLNSYKYFSETLIKGKIFAIAKEMRPTKRNDIFDSCANLDKDLLQKFNSLKKEKIMDINKIAAQDKDSLIYYNKEFKKLPSRGFRDKMDLVFTFSRIAFNKDYNKAIVIVGVSMGHLNGFSTLIYLEKQHYHWKIKCEKGLTIS